MRTATRSRSRAWMAAGLLLACALAGAEESAFSVTKGISSWQVLQRGDDDKATIHAEGTASLAGDVWASATRDDNTVVLPPARIASAAEGKWMGNIGPLPTGGEYTVTIELRSAPDSASASLKIEHVLVGDLWVLAGQSNMVGVGELDSPLVEKPDPRVHLFSNERAWEAAVEPLHAIFESQDPVQWAFLTSHKRSEAASVHGVRFGGAGIGLAFAKRITAETGVPVGIIAAAHGGTLMKQWVPDDPAQFGNSLSGFMLQSVEACGGRVKGVLWYQGESDALVPEEVPRYRQHLLDLVAHTRETTHDPNLPFIYSQIGRYIVPRDDGHRNWWAIQDLQRQCASEISRSSIITSADQPLNDTIHLSTAGGIEMGRRFAEQALRLAYERAEFKPAPLLDKITVAKIDRPILRVHFQDAAAPLAPAYNIPGFRIVDKEGKDQIRVFEARVDPERPECVLVYMTHKLAPGNEFFLTYGMDENPAVSLKDVRGQAAILFGPVPLANLQED